MKKVQFLIVILFTISSFQAKSMKIDKPKWVNQNDTICYIGNSITAGGYYHFFIDLYQRTRYPEIRYQSYNCGISGNTADDVLNRMTHDILIHKPTIATVKLGMNDVKRNLYHTSNPSPDSILLQNKAIDDYRLNMIKIADSLKAISCKLIFFTPSIYDQTVKIGTSNNWGVNFALKKCATIVTDLAKTYNSPVVDIYGTMNRLNLGRQRIDSTYTLVGTDRIHPGAIGHLVMAYTFLITMGADSIVSEIEIDAEKSKISKSINCITQKLYTSLSEISFEAKSNALPFPILESATDALSLIPFQQMLNQEILRIKHIKQGFYYLIIGNDTIGNFHSSSFEKGINLANYHNTPQYKQADSLMKLALTKHLLVANKLRIIANIEYSVLRNEKKDNMDSIKGILNEQLEKMKDKPYYLWLKSKYNDYPTLKEHEKVTIETINDLELKMYQSNKPILTKYSIRRVD